MGLGVVWSGEAAGCCPKVSREEELEMSTGMSSVKHKPFMEGTIVTFCRDLFVSAEVLSQELYILDVFSDSAHHIWGVCAISVSARWILLGTKGSVLHIREILLKGLIILPLLNPAYFGLRSNPFLEHWHPVLVCSGNLPFCTTPPHPRNNAHINIKSLFHKSLKHEPWMHLLGCY